MDNNTKGAAEKEYRELVELLLEKEEQRGRELEEQGRGFGLDGNDRYEDIRQWYRSELAKLKAKYGIA